METKIPPFLLTFACLCFMIITVVGFTGNLLAVFALSRSNARRSATTLLVINLSLCLLPLCAIAMPFMAIVGLLTFFSRGSTFISNTTIKVFFVLINMCNQVELHTITALAFNRTCAVAAPNFYRKYLKLPKVIWSALIFIWVYSILLWLPVSFESFYYLEVNMDEFFVELKDESHIFSGLQITLSFMLPFVFASVCHIIMFVKFRQSRRNVDLACGSRPWANHVTRTVCVVFLVLVACSVPHIVSHVLKRFGSWPRTWVLCHVAYYSRFVWDPCIYVLMSPSYRSEFKKCFSQFWHKKPPITATNNTTLPNSSMANHAITSAASPM